MSPCPSRPSYLDVHLRGRYALVELNQTILDVVPPAPHRSGCTVQSPKPDSAGPQWLNGFRDLCRTLQGSSDLLSRDASRGRIWLLLNSALSEYLRFHVQRLGSASIEDLEDIAAEKSLDLLCRIELGTWEAADRRSAEITGFLSKVARNGLVDRLRESGRRVALTTDDQQEIDPSAIGLETQGPNMCSPEPPDNLIERREFAGALRGCAESLDSRARVV